LGKSSTPLSYRDAGVDIEAGDAFIDKIKPIARSTRREGCLGGLGGFGAMFEVPARIKNPVLVSGTDGVGTKLKLAFKLDRHDTIGIDLVGMCVNDVLVQGAEPLFFLDYFATGKLSVETAASVVAGIGAGCRLANTALIGGETAEMPGMYTDGEYDLAGFCVGAVEKSRVINGSDVKAGDALIGLPSSGPHSNGYSLVRKVLEMTETPLSETMGSQTLGEILLEPTKIYVKPVLATLNEVRINALAHITGGGIPGNLARVLPEDCHAVVDQDNWEWPAVFTWLMERGNIPLDEMYRTFNCGIGMVLVVAKDQVSNVLVLLEKNGEAPVRLGYIAEGANEQRVVLV
jgi:phosphoribosylformylglycinamidine cyclo-ligase